MSCGIRLTGGARFDITLHMKKLPYLLLLSLLACLVGAGCGSIPKTTKRVARISQPPLGKALVNFHRPSNYGGGRLIAIFDGNGKMLMDLPGGTLFQHVCDPGEQVYAVWADHVTVVKGDLAPDKIYDIMVDVSMGWVQANIVLTPLSKDDPRRARLAEFERREKRTLGLNAASPRVAEYEAHNQPRIAEIKRDFLGGVKSDRVKYLQKDDCR
jgi:hypothetical protein